MSSRGVRCMPNDAELPGLESGPWRRNGVLAGTQEIVRDRISAGVGDGNLEGGPGRQSHYQ